MASEYLKWKYRDIKPDQPVEHTKKQKAANWWHYHKWWLLAGAVLVVALVDIGLNALGIGKVAPDYQLAYVASAPLSDETAVALEEALSSLGEDCNGDGRVVFKINLYVDMADSPDGDQPGYAYAASVKLMADLEVCESYFFICDDPETLHENFDILANAGGDIAGADESVAAYPLSICPALQDLAAQYPELEDLSLCRRGFWQDRVCGYRDECDVLWNRLTEEAES